jgi:DNA-binding MurR/RpiR family transcriptional regulator
VGKATEAKRNGSVTSHDIARLAQVSQATVSRVLRDDPKVNRTGFRGGLLA